MPEASSGVTFDLCTEDAAAEYLATANNYLRTAEGRGEDGYAMVSDFVASMRRRDRNCLTGDLNARGRDDGGHDTYSGDLLAHYSGDMPVWVFLEVVSFGTLANFWLYCSRRWSDPVMEQQHYALKSVKALRNVTAHGHCIVNGLTHASEVADYHTNDLITESLNEHGMRRTKSRRAKLANLRIAQMAATLYMLGALPVTEGARTRNASRLSALRATYEGSAGRWRRNSTISSFFEFLWKFVGIWLPVG